LDKDAKLAVPAYARKNGISPGKAASELILRGLRYQLGTRKLNGIPVFEVPENFPVITTERVRELLRGIIDTRRM